MKELNIIKYNLRVPKYLYDKLCKEADENRRSVNNEIVVSIARHVAKNDGSHTVDEVYWLTEAICKKLNVSTYFPFDINDEAEPPE
jgi:hypothetical protein